MVADEPENGVIGMAAATLFGPFGFPAPLFCQGYVWVDPACRGHGVGGALLDCVEKWAAASGSVTVGMGTPVGEGIRSAPGGKTLRSKGYLLREKQYTKGVESR